ncbi:hypothetical protein Agabi119p4_2587 [Agaricus bisporus var. burnettii]|uniref:Uncharacterized protein n=1 Tax=Agaricus bisporus var. burnettii TaxID=192524 RepID=A0A8H7KK82_AGABI|nr:hypothetical protein Agabi119p4_2587 [Agaricus bisporus var. burnettii]
MRIKRLSTISTSRTPLGEDSRHPKEASSRCRSTWIREGFMLRYCLYKVCTSTLPSDCGTLIDVRPARFPYSPIVFVFGRLV